MKTKGRMSKNVVDVRDSKKRDKYNEERRMDEDQLSNTKMRDKKSIARQSSSDTDLENTINNAVRAAVPEESHRVAKNLKNLKETYKPQKLSKKSGKYNSQVTPGKWETK